jgi:hypothetical protein
MRLALALVAIGAFSCAAAANFNCSGTPNTKPVWTTEPALVRKVSNGAYFVSGDATQNISVVHLYGSAYELG